MVREMTRPVVHFDETLGQTTRSGTWHELAVGTFTAIHDALAAAELGAAAELIRVTVEEARELREIYAVWPREILGWLRGQGSEPAQIEAARARLANILLAEHGKHYDLAVEWDRYRRLVDDAVTACSAGDPGQAASLVERAQETWRLVHDYCVDEVYGLLDGVVRLRGEDALPQVWGHLMRDWYDDHAQRLDVRNQPWEESAHQLMTAITHGFHGHLSGTDRSGGMTFTEEADRWGFRFDPCGSGGRVIRDDTTGGRPRPARPFQLAVTSRPYDWAWNRTGVQAYCVHCCLLNMVVPIDRLGYPTRVVEPPVWPEARAGAGCTWWIYKDPALVPDEVFARVGRRRPDAGGGDTP